MTEAFTGSMSVNRVNVYAPLTASITEEDHNILVCTTVYTKMLSFFVVFWQNAQHIFGCAFGYRVV